MGTTDFEDLRRHIGHKITCVCYRFTLVGRKTPIRNVSLECETCGEVLLDFDAP